MDGFVNKDSDEQRGVMHRQLNELLKGQRASAKHAAARDIWMFGHTLNGEDSVKIEPTEQSWCGQVNLQLKIIPKLVKAMYLGLGGFIVGSLILKLLLK